MKKLILAVILSCLATSLFGERLLKQSTQEVVRMCKFVAVGDGFTPVTNLDISTADQAELLKATGGTVDIAGATWAAITNADGCYDLTLTTSHTDTVGPVTIDIADLSLVLPITFFFRVLEESVYDNFYASGASLDDYRLKVGVTSTATTTEFIFAWFHNRVIEALDTGDLDTWCSHTGGEFIGTSGAPVTDDSEIGTTNFFLLSSTADMVDGTHYVCRGRATIDAVQQTDWWLMNRTGGNVVVTEISSDVWGTATTELAQSVPSATPSTIDAIMALYMALRNEVTVTSSNKTISNDAGTVIFKKALSDNGTTYTETEAEAGP